MNSTCQFFWHENVIGLDPPRKYSPTRVSAAKVGVPPFTDVSNRFVYQFVLAVLPASKSATLSQR